MFDPWTSLPPPAAKALRAASFLTAERGRRDATQTSTYTRAVNRGEADFIVSQPHPDVADFALLVAHRHAARGLAFWLPESYTSRVGAPMLLWLRSKARAGLLFVRPVAARNLGLCGAWVVVFSDTASRKRLLRPTAAGRQLYL